MTQQREPQWAKHSEATRARRATVESRTVRCGASATYTLQRSLRAPAEVRRFVEEHICPQHDTLAAAAVALVASEVVTHAALRGEGPITAALTCDVTSLTLTVSCCMGVPWTTSELRLGDPISSMIVASICRACGAEQTEQGLTMWFTIPTGCMPIPAPRDGRTSNSSQPVSSRPLTTRTLHVPSG